MSLVLRRQKKALEQVLQSQTTQEQVKPANSKISISSTVDQVTSTTELQLFQAAVDADLAHLKTIKDINKKAEFKAEAITANDYMSYLSRYKDSGDNYPNSVLSWVVIWLVDLGRWAQAFEYLPLLIAQGQHLPTQFNTKDWPTFFIDQLYDEGKKILDSGEASIIDSGITKQFNKMIDVYENNHANVSDVVGGKLYAIAAKLENCIHNYGNTIEYAKRAHEINDGAGVKKLARETAKKLGKEITI